MTTIDILKLIGAIILGYAIMIVTMWLFRKKKVKK
jgi:hypothetical protein